MIQRNVKTERPPTTGTSKNTLQQIRKERLDKVGHENKVAENVYPVTSAIRIYDTNTTAQMFVMNDRPQGGLSLTDGAIELIQNRRVLTMDSKGLGEKLNEVESGEGLHTKNTYYVGLLDSHCSDKQRTI